MKKSKVISVVSWKAQCCAAGHQARRQKLTAMMFLFGGFFFAAGSEPWSLEDLSFCCFPFTDGLEMMG